MPQHTVLIVFQTYHTAEPHRSMCAQLSPYTMRKSPLFTKLFVRLISEHDFCVAPDTLGLIKLTQPGKVQRRIQRGGGRGGRAPSPQKFQPCFFCCMACTARFAFDQRTVYVLSTALVTRSVSSQAHPVCVTAGRSI